jgi:hypothetical protein
VEAIAAVQITVERIDLNKLRMASIQHWQGRKAARGDYDADGTGADAATVRRWMINYARHCLTHCDAFLDQLSGQVGK